MISFYQTNLRLKITIIIIAAVTLFTAISVLFGLQQTRKIIENQANEHGLFLVKGLSFACADIMAAEQPNYEELKMVVGTIGRSYKSVDLIEVFMFDRLVAKYSRNEFKRGKEEKGLLALFRGESYLTYEFPIKLSMEVANGARGKESKIGFVNLKYSLKKYYKLSENEFKKLVGGSLVLLCEICIIVILLLNVMIFKPLSEMEEGANVIGGGDLRHRIHVTCRDEIGRLAIAFNNMTTNLQISKDEIERWNRTLEQQVQERTHELKIAHEKLKETQYELIQSGKMAAVGGVVAGVAHELNNPLSCVIGYSDLMLQKLQKNQPYEDNYEKYLKYLTYIGKEAKRCEGIVGNLLDFSRRQKTPFAPVDVRETIKTTLTVMEFQTRKWNIEMIPEFAGQLPTINGNSDKLQQVFINMIANAHTAMPEGGKMFINVKEQETEGSLEVVTSFTDTGCGIPKENLDKLFDSFFSTQRGSQNLGLGLSISIQIIKEHLGRIEVTSEVGKGTTFYIILPVLTM